MGINQDVIKIYNNKKIQFFIQNLIKIFLKSDWGIGEPKMHDFIFKIAISSFQNGFLLIVFIKFYFMIDIY